MGEAKRRKERDPNFGKTSKIKQNFDYYQKNMTKSQLINLNGFLGMLLGKITTRASNLVGDVELQGADNVQRLETYQELKREVEELVDFLEGDQPE